MFVTLSAPGATSCSRRYFSNCIGDAGPKRSSVFGFVIVIIDTACLLHHTSPRGLICACICLVIVNPGPMVYMALSCLGEHYIANR